MPQSIENKCCKHKKCVTKTRRFRKLCLDHEFLLLSCRNVGDIRNDKEDNSTGEFRKQAYRHFILDTYGYLGKGYMHSKDYPSPTVSTWGTKNIKQVIAIWNADVYPFKLLLVMRNYFC